MKSYIKDLCSQNDFLTRVLLNPYASHCEKQHQRLLNRVYYHLDDPASCLHDLYHKGDVNFWFLLEQGHNNIGDIAIGLGERQFFDHFFPTVPKHFVYEPVYAQYSRRIDKEISPQDVIILRGGGSIGNTIAHEKHREQIIGKFRNNLIVSMPQTMCFEDTKKGQRDKLHAVRTYSKNRNLFLIAREEKSYQDMQAIFPANNILLTPDIVMSMNYSFQPMRRDGILLCFRSDWEKRLSPDEIKEVERICRQTSDQITYTDMYAKEVFIPFEQRETIFHQKVDQFKQASLVITDRLHGMVFSAITGTPCIALANYNHKVEETYKWLKHLPYIRFCQSLEEIKENIPVLYGMQGTYNNDFALPYYEKIAEYIKTHLINNT